MKNLNFLSKLWSLSRADRVRTLAIEAVSLPSFCRVNMLKLVSVLALVMTFGVGNAWGVAVKDTITLEGFAGSTSTSYVTSVATGATHKGVAVKMCNWTPAGSNKNQIRVNQGNTSSLSTSNFYVYNNAAMPGSITKVELIMQSGSTTENYFQIASSSISARSSNPSYNTSNKGTHISSTQSLQWTFTESSGIRYFRISCAKNGGTLKAYRVVITYEVHTVTYNGNGNSSGTVPTDATKYLYNQSVTVLGNTGNLAKTGFTFSGWNTKADGSGADKAASAIFNITQDTILYAKWTAAASCSADPTIGAASLNGSF